ncbi:MAG: hypothetical protein ACRC62_24565, partial [Microcoleus sp.]
REEGDRGRIFFPFLSIEVETGFLVKILHQACNPDTNPVSEGLRYFPQSEIEVETGFLVKILHQACNPDTNPVSEGLRYFQSKPGFFDRKFTSSL